MEDLSLTEFLRIFFKHLILIIFLTIIGAAIMWKVTEIRTHTEYEANSQILINLPEMQSNENIERDNNEMDRLLNTSGVLIKSRVILSEVKKSLKEQYGYDISIERIEQGLEIKTTPGAQVLSVKVTNNNAKHAVQIANLTAEKYLENATNLLDVGKIDIISRARKSSMLPNNKAKFKNAFFGLVIGLFVGILVAVLRELMNHTIRTESYITNKYNIEQLGSINSFTEWRK